MIPIKGVLKRNPREPENAPLVYASAQHDARIDLDGLATSVAERCSLRRADVHGVLIALMDLIPNELLNGKIVSLGSLGSFYVTVKSDGVTAPEDMKPSMVKASKIQYKPTKELRKELRKMDVSIVS